MNMLFRIIKGQKVSKYLRNFKMKIDLLNFSDNVDPTEATEAPWEAVPPQYDVSDFGENQGNNNVFISSVAPNPANIKQSQPPATQEHAQPNNFPTAQENGNIQCVYIISVVF